MAMVMAMEVKKEIKEKYRKLVDIKLRLQTTLGGRLSALFIDKIGYVAFCFS